MWLASWNGVENAILGGWQANVIEKATSGFPLFLVDTQNQLGSSNFEWNGTPLNRPDRDGGSQQRWTGTGGTNCPAQVHNNQYWFNPCAFTHAPAGELGSIPVLRLSGPRFVNTDFSVFKTSALAKQYALKFRAEFFNLFNHAQFGLTGNGVYMQDMNSPSTFGAGQRNRQQPARHPVRFAV